MFLYINFQHTAVTRPLFNLNAHCGKVVSLLKEIEIHAMEHGCPIHPLKANHQFLAKLYTQQSSKRNVTKRLCTTAQIM